MPVSPRLCYHRACEQWSSGVFFAMSIPDPEQFCRQWAQAWNSRDLEGVLRHFHDDVLLSLPAWFPEATRVSSSFVY
jgi:hypothetical protein